MATMPGWVEKIILDMIVKYVAPIIADWIKNNLTGEKIDELVKAAAKQLVCWADAQAKDTASPIDDAFVKTLAAALGIDPAACKVP